jgi:hypothetical protein
MRAKALLSLAGAFIAAVALVSASGAATTKAQKVNKINVSTRAAVVHYLRSIHVNPKGAVIQRGLRNYAGARCPGKHWACASTKHTVVQITGHGGKNRFACTRSHCTVVQISGVSHGVYVFGRQLAAKGSGGNSASCVKTGSGATTGTGQSCTILQSGSGSNTAAVYQNSMKVSGLLAAAAYTASITQTATGATSGNQACVLQAINLDGSTTGLKNKPVSVTLDGHQSVIIKQDVAGTGANHADQAAVLNSGGTTASCDTSPTTAILQSQTITSTVNGTGPITQSEDQTSMPCGDGNATHTTNICLDIEQNKGSVGSTAGGTNSAVFDQENQLVALANTATGGTITQTQGNSDPGTGGLAATINQYSTGQSAFTATQNETQCEDAFKNTTLPTPTNVALCSTTKDLPSGIFVTQKQYGPEGMGYRPTKENGRIHYQKVTKDPSDSTQLGNPNDSFSITQKSKQNNDTDAVQNNHIIGGASTPGNGTVTQNAIIQNNNKLDLQAGTGTVSGQIDCTGSTKATCTKTLSVPLITQTPNDPSDYGSGLDFNFQNADPSVTFLCSVDGAAFGSCSSVAHSTNTTGSQTTSGLASGYHTFQVKTEDPDTYPNPGSTSDPTPLFHWVITPPDPTISTGPGTGSGSQVTSTSATFTFADDDSTVLYECNLDGGGYSACSPNPTFTNLSHGPHTLDVKATDHTGIYESTGNAEYTWEVIPYLTFEWTDDGASSGWAGVPGSSSIFLTTGSVSATTFAQFTIHDRNDLKVSDLASLEPSFNTDTYVGAPRYEIDLDNGDYLFGYPPQAGFGSNSWDINCGGTNLSCVPMSFVSWAQVQAAEGGATITDALIEADFPTNHTYSIANFTYDNYGPGDVAP